MSDKEKKQSYEFIVEHSRHVVERINTFTTEVFETRGGRVGSGMGGLLESLWGYFMNKEITENADALNCEIAWLQDNEYNDFACVQRSGDWDAATKQGEFFRIEAKSMNTAADESKAHFDQLRKNLGDHDLLLVLVWKWVFAKDGIRVSPVVSDYFIGLASDVATLRDALHVARGGTFIDRTHCPDGCDSALCQHHGEPLNASGKRERKSGPASTRPSQNVSFAANFGGLVRMLKTNSNEARKELREIRKTNDTAHAYISFIHRNFPNEEKNQYLSTEWQELLKRLGMTKGDKTLDALIEEIRQQHPNYHDQLRQLAIPEELQ